MINIHNHQVELEGTRDELHENMMDFIIFLITNKEGSDYKKVFSPDGMLRGLYTACSTKQSLYKDLLECNKKVLSDIESGKFKLVYKEIGHDIEIPTMKIDLGSEKDE